MPSSLDSDTLPQPKKTVAEVQIIMIHDVTAYATTSSRLELLSIVCNYTVYEACHVMHEAPTLPQRQLHVALKALFDPSLPEFKSCRAREDQPF